jgi:hypothetical protein
MILPDSNVLPAPLWLITTLHILTLTLHFGAMNFLVGGMVLVLTGRFTRRWQNPTVRRVIALLPSIMAATVTLGVAPLLFLQLVYPAQMYSASIVSGWFWFLIIPALIAGYSLLYRSAFGSKSGRSGAAGLLWPALAAVVYVSLVYSSVFSMAERPDTIQRLYAAKQTGVMWNPAWGDYVFRWLHMMMGAVTVGGFCVGVLGRDDPEAFPAAKHVFAWGMGAAALAGFGYLGSLGAILPAFMRSSAIWVLTAGILLAAGSLHFFFKRHFLPSGIALFSSLLLMVATRHQVRILRLQGTFDPAAWKVTPQWSAFLVFLASFVLALALVGYMLRLFFRRAADDARSDASGGAGL